MLKIADLPTFDLAEQLRDEADIQAYLNLVMNENDPAELAHALGIIARARGMTQISQDAGISREALYKALRPNAVPRFDTINRVLQALGYKLAIVREDTPTQYGKSG
ncbi:probable addiction module antidote protein [Arsukibacterium tuosuense]|uniref:Probable addiction module antidote protein n=1 Tax=Arsukibacterium tuosuense TaxID=1323745 RepID=A0A285J9N1_9GAMM|nr:addiction module antidote protein [Arsukibacterium tuosuense]SNY56597.1 probable addiction module antidote protein [Arsukibacterium tuosuense]